MEKLIQEKQKAIEVLERIVQQRKFSSIFIVLAFFFSRVIAKNFPEYAIVGNLILISVIFIVLSIFPLAYFVKQKKESLSSGQIYFIVAIDFTIELLLLLFVFYLSAPIMIHYFGNVIFVVGMSLILYNILSNPIFNSKKYNTFFFVLSCIFLFLFCFLEYFNLYPAYSLGSITIVNSNRIIVSSFLSSFVVLFTIHVYTNNFWEMFRKQARELEDLNESLEERVSQRTEELQDAKSVLEVKVRARTRELEELTQNLEKDVQERTRELQNRVDELEGFHKLVVGRELKMVELKE
ncbi:MAG: hypothetical protein ABH967_00895, partial [Patescibacteria group bacterium]